MIARFQAASSHRAALLPRDTLSHWFGGLTFMLDASGAAYLPDRNTLIVSDLHLEKGSRAASRGHPVPSLDSYDTLCRLRSVVEKYRPARVVCLGDSFQDVNAGGRMITADRDALHALCRLVRDWVWVYGNHDPEVPAFCSGTAKRSMTIAGVTFRHEPETGFPAPQVIGHYHPKATISAFGVRVSGACFCISDRLFIMPAFGAFTGGLSCSHPAIRSVHDSAPAIHMIYGGKLWPVAPARTDGGIG